MAWFAQALSRSARQWYQIRLLSEQVDTHEHERIKLLFGSLFMAAHRPRGMTLWLTPRDDGGADLYFSPAAAYYGRDVLRHYQGQSCPEPEPDSLYPYAGYGYADSSVRLRPLQPRSRSFLPVAYSVRSLRGFHSDLLAAHRLLIDGQVAPYVQRYIKAWFR